MTKKEYLNFHENKINQITIALKQAPTAYSNFGAAYWYNQLTADFIDRNIAASAVSALQLLCFIKKKQDVDFLFEVAKALVEITAAKNADYTGVNDDPFANFKLVTAYHICSVEQGFLTRMCDKLSRIKSFLDKGELKVKDESVTDTLLDFINYCILYQGYVKSINEITA